MGHYCGFRPSVGQYGTIGYASSFPQLIGMNGTRKKWDYGGWHNITSRSCHQQVNAAGISPGSGYDHVQRNWGNVSTGSNKSDSTYWNIHTYQMPDHVQETCSTDFTSSDGSDDCYWSVHTFPVSSTKAHVTQTQPSILDGTVDDSMIVPQTTEYHEMKVHKVLNPVPEVQTLECVTPGQQSQQYEKNENSTTHDDIWEQMKEEIAEYFTKSKQNEQEAHEEEDPESGAIVETVVGLDPFFDDAFELFDPGIDTSVQQFSYALPIQYLQQLQQHKTCQPVVSADCALLGNNRVMSLQSLQLSKLLVNESEGSADCVSQLIIPREIHNLTVHSLLQEIFYVGKPPMSCRGFIMPLCDEQKVITVKGTCDSTTVPVLTRNEGCETNNGLLLLHYSTPKDKPLFPWDPGEQEILVLIMLDINMHVLTLEEFEGSGEYKKQAQLCLPWDPGEQGLVHVHNMAITLFHLASSDSSVVQWQFICQEEFNEASTLQGNEFSLVSSPYLITVHPVLKSEPDLHLLQPDDLLVDTISLSSKVETNLLCTPWAGEIYYVAPAIIEIWRGLEKLMCWTQYSFVLYLPTYTISLVKAVPCLLLALVCKGVQVVFVFYSRIILQVMQNTYILLLDMNAQGDLHDTDCSHLSLHEFSAIIIALFKVCIDIWNSADTMARVLTGNVVDTYTRIFARALLQAEKCFLLNFSLIFDSIVHVLYISKIEKSLTALNEQVQMGRIAKYMHWIPYSYFIGLKEFPVSINFFLWWFPAYKRAFVQWDPGIIFSVIYKVEMLTAWQDSNMTQVPDPLIRSSCMHMGAEAALYTLHNHTLVSVGIRKLHITSSLMDLTRILNKPYFVMAMREFTFLGKMNVTSGS